MTVRARTPSPALLLVTALALSPGAHSQDVPTAPADLRHRLADELVPPVLTLLGDRATAGQDLALRVTGAVPAALLDGVRDALREALTPRTRRLVVLSSGDDVTTSVDSARAADADLLVFVRVTATVGALGAQAETLRVQPGAWATFLLATLPPPVALGATGATVPLDAVTRGLLGVATPPRWPAVPTVHPRRIDTPFRGTVALATGDLDADGHDELVLATTDRVRVAHLAGASLAFAVDSPGASLGVLGWASVPLRQPLGSMAWDPGTRAVLVRTSAQSGMGAVTLVSGAVRVTALPAANAYPVAGYGCMGVVPGGDTVTGIWPDCAHGGLRAIAQPLLTLTNGATVAAVPVGSTVTDAMGHTHRVEALADGAGGCELRVDGQRVGGLADVVPPLALADIDGDGRVELLAASASVPGAPDRLRVFTVTATGGDERPGFPLPGPIEGIAVGDLDGDGLLDTVVAAQDPVRRATTLWIVP